jgi:hypothetical protein
MFLDSKCMDPFEVANPILDKHPDVW